MYKGVQELTDFCKQQHADADKCLETKAQIKSIFMLKVPPKQLEI